MQHAAEIIDRSGALGHKALCQVLKVQHLIKHGPGLDPMADQAQILQGDADFGLEERLAEHEMDFEAQEREEEDGDGEEGGCAHQ